MALEEARYKVLEREGVFELRQYELQIVAETLVEFVPVCPEVECGLGIPREAMHHPALLLLKIPGKLACRPGGGPIFAGGI